MRRHCVKPRFNPDFVALGLLAVLLCQAGVAAEDFQLPYRGETGELTRVTARLKVDGTLQVHAEGKKKSLRMAVAGALAYDEQLLQRRNNEICTLRHYRQAQADIQVEDGRMSPRLSADRDIVAVVASERAATLFSPQGPLTREELDVIELQANTALLHRLLPDQAVAKGDTWKPAADALALLLTLDAVSVSEVECKLASVQMQGKQPVQAEITFAGNVDGAIHGVATEIQLAGTADYDFSRGRIVQVELELKEKRSMGHVGPGLDVTATVTLDIAPLDSSASLLQAAERLSNQPADDTAELLHYTAHTTGFQILHDRRWHVMDEGQGQLLLRMVDRGELVAQARFGSSAQSEGDFPTLEFFQQEIEKGLGDRCEKVVAAVEGTNRHGLSYYRVTVEGKVDDLPIRWIYFLIGSPQGQRVSMGVTVEPELVSRLGKSADQMISSLKFLQVEAATARTPDSGETPKR